MCLMFCFTNKCHFNFRKNSPFYTFNFNWTICMHAQFIFCPNRTTERLGTVGNKYRYFETHRRLIINICTARSVKNKGIMHAGTSICYDTSLVQKIIHLTWNSILYLFSYSSIVYISIILYFIPIYKLLLLFTSFFFLKFTYNTYFS